MDAPAPRPAQSFSSARAQRWVLGAAIVIAMTYALRRLVEPSMSTAATSSKASRIAGTGGPPPTLAHWAAAYGTGFTLLAIVSMGAPELAASLAMLMVAGSLLANGKGIVSDLATLEGKPKPLPKVAPPGVIPTLPQAMELAREHQAAQERAAGLPVILGAPR